MMTNALQIEKAVENVLAQSAALLQSGDKVNAFRTMNGALTDHKVKVWVRQHEDLAKKYFDLCLREQKEASIRDVLTSYQRLTSNAQELEAFGTLVLYLLDEEQKRVENFKPTQQIKNEARTWSLFSGESEESYISRQLDGLIHSYASAFNSCSNRCGLQGKYELLLQKVTCHGINFARKFNRPNEFGSFSDSFRRHYDKIMNPDWESDAERQKQVKDHRTYIFNNAEVIEAIAQTRLLQLEVATELRLWRSVASILEETKKFFDEVSSQRKSIKRPIWIGYYKNLAVLFKAVNLPTLHCAAMITQARLTLRDANAQPPTLLASQTVLALLTVPKDAGVSALALSHDNNKEKIAILERHLNLITPPTRVALCQDVSVGRPQSILEVAQPHVRALFDLLYDVTTVDVCQQAAPLLARLAEVPELASYVRPLEDVAIVAMLDLMNRCIDRISVKNFFALVPFLKESDYITRVEPLLLSGLSEAQISIDMASQCIRFVGANHEDVLGAMGELADKLAAIVGPCYQHKIAATATPAPAAKGKSSSASPARPSEAPPTGNSLFKQMLAERELIRQRRELVEARLAKEADRKALEKLREEERRKAEIDRLRQLEATRNEKRRQEADAEQVRKYNEAKALEQRKWCCAVLRKRYPEIAERFDDKLAFLGVEQFKEELVKILTKFTKDRAYKKLQGVRDREYIERASREREIPKILALAEATKETPEQRAERLALRKEQGKKDHEAQLIIKKRLAMFESSRQAYQREVVERFRRVNAAKMSKRDKQEDILRQEKERREAEAAAEAAEEARKAEEERKRREATPPPSGGPAAALKPSPGAWRPGAKK